VKTREIVVRSLKARVVSWLTVTPQAVLLPGADSPYVLAVYYNGRYVEPATITIPDGVPPEWGPDGPWSPKPPESPDKPEGGGDDNPTAG
jgi:hypothetical protein